MDIETARARMAAAPADPAPRYDLAATLLAAGRDAPDLAAEGEAVLDDARLLHSIAVMRNAGADVQKMRDDGGYAAMIAGQLYAQRYVAVAGVAYGMAIAKDNVEREVLLSFGLSLMHQGRAEQAIRLFTAAADMYPSAACAQFALYPHFMVENGVERHAEAARRWASMYALPRGEVRLGNRPRKGRRLRVGYVAPTFSKSQSRQFIGPMLDCHDRGAVEVFLYPNQSEPAVWAQPVTVRPLGGLNDEQACAAIRADRIDVLIDIWGHTAGNRLTMFSHRCAPVQASWINYQQTTGMPAMDYVLCADSVVSPAMAGQFTEQVVHVGPASAPFRADVATRTPAPILTTGVCSFGAFINPAKLSDQTVAAWSRILRGAPAARLLLKYGYFDDPVLQAVTRTRFLAHGVGGDRILFEGHTTGEAYEAAFARVDLALDPSPCPGGTTTLEAMSRGVPVLTLDGADYYAKVGLQIALCAGLPEMIAADWDDYVSKAVALAADAAALDLLRDKTRQGMDAAMFADGPRMAAMLEQTYAALFDRWIERQGVAGAVKAAG